jgi:hypothetical protein
MENSPPGIQTIPSGALPGDEFLFAIVAANFDVPQNAGLDIKSAATKTEEIRCIVRFYCRASVSDASLFF